MVQYTAAALFLGRGIVHTHSNTHTRARLSSPGALVVLVNSKVTLYSELKHFFVHSLKGQFHHDGFYYSPPSIRVAPPSWSNDATLQR